VKKRLCEFLDACVTPYHTASEVKRILLENGFEEIFEDKDWSFISGGAYFFTHGGALIAFKIPCGDVSAFQLAAAHSDSPCFFVKSERTEGAYTRLSVEKYGGMIPESWFDRPLSLAGRIMLRGEKGVEQKFFRYDDALVIPSLAPHLSKDVKDKALDIKSDLLPVLSGEKKTLASLISSSLSCEEKDILSKEVYLISAQKAFLWNEDKYVSSPRLDDLQCVFALLCGLIASKNEHAIPLLAIFSSEEVGSLSGEGADSTILCDTLERIALAIGKSSVDYAKMRSASFMLSADNAHAVHPAHPELSDKDTGGVYINGGIVLKHSASHSYATDAFSEGLIVSLLKKENIPYQSYYNRADMRGGSTLGPISLRHVSVPTVDVGLAQLAMHSAVETAGAEDTEHFSNLAKAYFSVSLSRKGDAYAWIK